jgi:Protein of unknown function (DUF2442)
MKPKITQVEALLATRLRITWENGKHAEVDVGDYLQAPGYERLRDPAFFSNVQVEEWGHGVEWPAADIGIPADALYRLSKEQTGDAFPTEQFNAWMKRHGLSLSAAAQALHLTRRTIIYYSTGAKPIPAYIGLACKGWEAGHRTHAA